MNFCRDNGQCGKIKRSYRCSEYVSIRQKILLEVGFKYLCFIDDVDYNVEAVVMKIKSSLWSKSVFFT